MKLANGNLSYCELMSNNLFNLVKIKGDRMVLLYLVIWLWFTDRYLKDGHDYVCFLGGLGKITRKYSKNLRRRNRRNLIICLTNINKVCFK
jgi:hypothetical protein